MEDVEFWNNALFINDTMIIGDLHLGYSNWQGPDFSTSEYDEIISDVKNLLQQKNPERVILIGDVFHNFNSPSEADKSALDKINKLVSKYGAKLEITPGNHDTYKFNEDIFFSGTVKSEIQLDNNGIVLHGHESPSEEADYYVIGHLHPTIDVEGVKHKCFLRGVNAYNDSTVYILPTFSNRPPGTPVLNGTFVDSPFISNGNAIDYYEVIVWDDEEKVALEFPNIKTLKEHSS